MTTRSYIDNKLLIIIHLLFLTFSIAVKKLGFLAIHRIH